MSVKTYLMHGSALLLSGAGFFATTGAIAAAQAQTGQTLRLDEITVTARRREESLQSVPDAVTAFSAATLENAGIRTIGGFMDMVPNLTFRDGGGFRKGDIRISMRGIGNGQEGWAPVTFLVDGVPASSLDAINSGSLTDIERIEVLRGPQSALYGAGAIAGAINVVTQAPTNDYRFKVKAGYAKGNDKRLDALASGPLVEDKVLFQLRGSLRDSDGLIDSASNGIDLDFEEHQKISGRLIFTPADNFEIDLRAEYLHENNGSTYQDKLTGPELIETFNDATEPRRRFAGNDVRDFYNFSAKAEWTADWGAVISVTGYNEVDQEINSSVCWDDPDNPAVDTDPLTPGGQVGCLFGTAVGSAAGPGEVVDNLFNSVDNFKTFTQDVRLVSSPEQAIRWVVGASYLSRKTITGFDASLIVGPDEEVQTLFPAWHAKKDTWWGVYGQVSADITDRLELTFAARYDDNKYEDTQYTDRDKTAVVMVLDENGIAVPTQVEKEDSFQPKVQLSYDVSDQVMVYATWSKGFRAGSFNTGAYTLPEKTTNYEIGTKATVWDGRMIVNAAAFHIDYSDQQFSTVISTPPFRFPVTIPKTNINGVELEGTVLLTEGLTVSAGLGYLDSKLAGGGGHSPIAPEWTWNVASDYVVPVADEWDLRLHGDYRHNGSMYLGQNQTSQISAKNFVNLRAGVENDQWKVTGFVENLFDVRQAEIELSNIAGGYARPVNRPRSFGVEVTYTY